MATIAIKKKLAFLSAIMLMFVLIFYFLDKSETRNVSLIKDQETSLPEKAQGNLIQEVKDLKPESDLKVKKNDLNRSNTNVTNTEVAYQKHFDVLSVEFTDDHSIFADDLKVQLNNELVKCGTNAFGITSCPESKMNVVIPGTNSSSGFDGEIFFTFFQFSSSNYFYLLLRYFPRDQDPTTTHILKMFGIKKELPNPFGISFHTEAEFDKILKKLYKAGKGVPREVYSKWLNDRNNAFKEGFSDPLQKAKPSEDLTFEEFNQMLVSDVGFIHIADIYISDSLH